MTPELGTIEVNIGVGGFCTVNVAILLVPPSVVTVTFLLPVAAVAEIAKVAVIVVSLTTLTPLTVIPVPDTVSADFVSSQVPVMVTGTV